MRKLLLVITIGLFSPAITINGMEPDKSTKSGSKIQDLENLTKQDLEDKSVDELNRLYSNVIFQRKMLSSRGRAEAMEKAAYNLKTNPDAEILYINIGYNFDLYQRLIKKIEEKIKRLSDIARLISATIKEKGGINLARVLREENIFGR